MFWYNRNALERSGGGARGTKPPNGDELAGLSGKPVGALFLSPHFDDVALSCGGTVALAAADGPTHVVTVFAAQPPGDLNDFARFQHDRWGTREDTVNRRREEDGVDMPTR